MITLELTPDGYRTTIPDAKGKAHAYSLRRAPSALSLRAYLLVRLDRPAAYRVSREHDGRWRCTCGDWQWRRRSQGGDCKHIAMARELYALEQSLVEAP